MKKIFAILTFWALAGMVSCSNEPEVIDPADGAKTYELSIETDETRVEYNHGGEDGATHKYRWEKGDELAVWYSVANAESYSAIEKPFVASLVETGKPVVFYTSATSPDQMTKGQTYDYIAMYPYPTTISGTDVTYTLGTATAEGAYVQKKEYEGDYQILRAAGEDKIAMTDGRPTLSEYKQLMTTLQFYVNSENSAGAYTDIKITELQIYFPENVTGVLTIDAKTGEIKSATSRRVDVEMSSAPMGAYATRQAAREAVDYVNVVCKPFTMQAYNTATPAENRIVINVIGKGKNTTSGVTETISQSIFKTVSAAKEFKAADVIAMRLDLTDEWKSYVPTIGAKSYYCGDSSLSNQNADLDESTGFAGYHCDTDADGNILLSNFNRSILGSNMMFNSSVFLISLDNLAGYDVTSTLIVEFEAAGIWGNKNGTDSNVADDICPLAIMSTNSLTFGNISEWFGAVNPNKLETVSLPAEYIASGSSRPSASTTPAKIWNKYTVTIRDLKLESSSDTNYLAFSLNGGFYVLSSAEKNACWIRNIKLYFQSGAN